MVDNGYSMYEDILNFPKKVELLWTAASISDRDHCMLIY